VWLRHQQCAPLDQGHPGGRPIEDRSSGSGFDSCGRYGGPALGFFRTSPLAGATALAWRRQVASGANQFVKAASSFPDLPGRSKVHVPIRLTECPDSV
jgi:hypothetical protein